MLATIFHKMWHVEIKMQKNAKPSFFFEQDQMALSNPVSAEN